MSQHMIEPTNTATFLFGVLTSIFLSALNLLPTHIPLPLTWVVSGIVTGAAALIGKIAMGWLINKIRKRMGRTELHLKD